MGSDASQSSVRRINTFEIRLMGYGYVGLAVSSLIVNIVALIWLYILLRTTLFKPEWTIDWSLQRWMLRISGPLMINHLLATIFGGLTSGYCGPWQARLAWVCIA